MIKEHQGQTRGRQDNAAYASMIRAVDDSVGQILDTLDQLALSQNTTVIFFSDMVDSVPSQRLARRAIYLSEPAKAGFTKEA